MVQLARPIVTERLRLRRFELSDLDDLVQILGREDVNRYLYSSPRDRATVVEVLTRRLELPEELADDNLLWVAVSERDGDRVVGEFMLHWTANDHRQGEMGGSLHPDVHGNGYATEIYHELLTLAFVTFELHRVVGRCDARNEASIRSLAKAGLHQEAYLVENEFVKGEWTSEVIMALRRSEWEASRNESKT